MGSDVAVASAGRASAFVCSAHLICLHDSAADAHLGGWDERDGDYPWNLRLRARPALRLRLRLAIQPVRVLCVVRLRQTAPIRLPRPVDTPRPQVDICSQHLARFRCLCACLQTIRG